MKRSGKWLAVLLTVAMVFTVIFTDPGARKVQAITRSPDAAIEWCNSVVGQQVGTGECVALIEAYYEWFGVTPSNVDGKDYATADLPSGWTRVQGGTPQKGDILIYTGGQYGHVAIYESDTVTYHQNFDNTRYVLKVTGIRYDGLTNPYWGYIRPSYTNDSRPEGYVGFCEQRDDQLYVYGWAFDLDDTSRNVDVNIYSGSELIAAIKADKVCETVNTALGVPGNHGFEAYIDISPGRHTIYFNAVNSEAPDNPTRIGTESVCITAPGEDTGSTTLSSTASGVEGFVERLYILALNRTPDASGRQNWIDALNSGSQNGADVARGFLYSPEFISSARTNADFVRILYKIFFDREADDGGLYAWVNVMGTGQTKGDVIEGFINSSEWTNVCIGFGIPSGGNGAPTIEVEPNQDTIDFATRLYTTCLSRNADQNGLMAWALQLANQRDTGTGAARGFFFSEEFTRQNVGNEEYVTRLYRTFMGREPDQAGFDAWVRQLNSGVSREEVFNGFSQSPEFTAICSHYGIIRG